MVRPTSTFLQSAGLEVAPYGILSPATTVVEDNNDWWLSGFNYDVQDAGVVIENAVAIGGPVGESQVIEDNSANKETYKKYYPFLIKTTITSSTFGVHPDDIESAATTALNIVTQKAVESEFWHGHIAQKLTADNDNRYLSYTDAIDVTPTAGTAVKVRYGQALLEEALGESTLGVRGVIHAPRLIASVLQASDNDGALVTNLGNSVVAGAGYSHVGPDGTIAPTGKAWMYATGPVTVRLGSVQITPSKMNQAIDHRTNTIQYFVDRSAAVTWSTTNLHAVLVDLSLDYA